MSLLVPEERGFDFLQWEDDPQVLDEMINYFGGVTEGLPEMSQLMGLPDMLMRDSPSSIHSTSVTSTPSLSRIDKDTDASTNPILMDDKEKEGSHKAISKPQKRRKGRPKLDLDDPKAVKERRRKQIRVAQQAYRHRKEASITSIQKENEELRIRLENIQTSFSQLLSISLNSSLPPTELSAVQSLSNVVEQQGLLQTPARNQSETSTQFREEPPRLPKSQDSLTNVSNYIHHNPRITNGPYVSLLDQVPYVSIPFRLRLRIEALKYGHNLILNPESSFDMLRQTFQHHIFTETRESIFRRIYQQLDQAIELMSRMAQCGNRESVAIGDLWNPPLSRENSFAIDWSNEISLDPAGYHSTSELEPSTEEVLLDDGQIYVYSTAVERILLDRGFIITDGSHFITVPAGSKLRISEQQTMFDEIRGNRELKLNVLKFLNKLLTSGACLDTGPGFRLMEIDKALWLSIVDSL